MRSVVIKIGFALIVATMGATSASAVMRCTEEGIGNDREHAYGVARSRAHNCALRSCSNRGGVVEARQATDQAGYKRLGCRDESWGGIGTFRCEVQASLPCYTPESNPQVRAIQQRHEEMKRAKQREQERQLANQREQERQRAQQWEQDRIRANQQALERQREQDRINANRREQERQKRNQREQERRIANQRERERQRAIQREQAAIQREQERQRAIQRKEEKTQRVIDGVVGVVKILEDLNQESSYGENNQGECLRYQYEQGMCSYEENLKWQKVDSLFAEVSATVDAIMNPSPAYLKCLDQASAQWRSETGVEPHEMTEPDWERSNDRIRDLCSHLR